MRLPITPSNSVCYIFIGFIPGEDEPGGGVSPDPRQRHGDEASAEDWKQKKAKCSENLYCKCNVMDVKRATKEKIA